MMDVIKNLTELGSRLKTGNQGDSPERDIIESASAKNPWFSKQFLQYAIDAIADDMLNEYNLRKWLPQDFAPVKKCVGLIFAGNLPLVGFHDFLCCYVAGCSMKIKLSSKDDELFPFILELLGQIDPEFEGRVEIVDRLKDFDAVIATGSDNTNRYFEYYFRNYPKILRKNRNSVAVLTGQESASDLEKLADDIFMYFGFGCRNVSKIYVPLGFDVRVLFPHFGKYAWLHQHSKYMNNYDYYRTILLLNKTEHLANDFVMLMESPSIPSPISVLHYEYWHNESELEAKLNDQRDKIQCIVAGEPERWKSETVLFGQTQHPALWDYADGVDTLAFLKNMQG